MAKFRVQQFASGYVIWEVEAKNRKEAQRLVNANNSGDISDEDFNKFKQIDFEAEDGGDMGLCK